jgi:PIN domain
MPKIKISTTPTHIVVVDTNILWDSDKKNAVSPLFDSFWQKNKGLIPLELVVPEVVIGELEFQQVTSAIKVLASISANMKELAGIADAIYTHKYKDSEIKKQVNSKIGKWLRNLDGKIAVTPLDTIDWTELTQNAIWRKPPFTSDPKDPKNEKGFRDALILETFINLCNENEAEANKNVVFICNDFLLRTAAEDKLKNSTKVLFYESLEDFGSYINLTQEEITNNVVKLIMQHARTKFFSRAKINSIYYKEKIKERIKTELAEHLMQPVLSHPTNRRGLFTDSPENWKLNKERWLISAPRFNTHVVGESKYYWTSRIQVAKLYIYDDLVDSSVDDLKIHLVGFDVSWSAKVKSDGRFHNIEVGNINFAASAVLPPTKENFERYNLISEE